MIKKWLVATYKINEVKRLEKNLLNQKFDFFLPKITVKKNSKSKEEALFPGYIFINTSFENYSSLKYTIGIKNILKFRSKLADNGLEDCFIVGEFQNNIISSKEALNLLGQ